MPTFSQEYNIGKSQPELDFVDVPINQDIPLFIDPFAVSQRPDRWSQNSNHLIIFFFQQVVENIQSGKLQKAKRLLSHFHEPNETRFGYSKNEPQGAGIGSHQANQILRALLESSAVKTGFISSLEEAELMIRGIGRDKISDLTTNIIRKRLADYTREQCNLHGIATQKIALAPYFSKKQNGWINEYYELPVVNGAPILLVPKSVARYDLAYDHQQYYRHFVLNYLQAEALNAGSSLVRTLKNGKKVVYKKDIEATFKCTKENLYEFSKEHPEVLEEYREQLAKWEKEGYETPIGKDEEPLVADALIEALQSIPRGGDDAEEYHSLMTGVVEFLFFPHLLYPAKEKEIHQGRKRIDIVMENGARNGVFHRLHDVKDLPCAYVPIECKNYTTEVNNPELDQLAGRFSTNRGKFGILLCRYFESKDRFIERCRDTIKDGRGLIIPMDDETVLHMLKLVRKGQRHKIDRVVGKLINEIWVS